MEVDISECTQGTAPQTGSNVVDYRGYTFLDCIAMTGIYQTREAAAGNCYRCDDQLERKTCAITYNEGQQLYGDYCCKDILR